LFEGVLVKLGVVVVPWRNGFLCHDLMIDDIVFNLELFFYFMLGGQFISRVSSLHVTKHFFVSFAGNNGDLMR